MAAAGAAEEDREVVADQFAAAAGEACPILLASVGGEPSDAPPLRVDGTADRVAAPASGIGQTAERADLSDERATDGKVSERSVQRGMVPSLRSLRGAETAPLCGPWRQAAMLTRLTVAFDAGQMYAAERRRSPKWKFRFKCIRGRSGTRWPPGRCGSGERCKRK